MGKIKYFALMTIPLIYYIYPFESYFGDQFFSSLQSSPVFFSVIYVLIFSAAKQVAALLFSLAFWTASSLVHDNRIRNSLLISSIGMAFLFGSIEIAALQYHVYPPYGLVTEAFIPLGAYLLFLGIFTSAKYVSQDGKLRKEFYKSAANQLALLKNIGVLEMEKEFGKKVKYLEERSRLLGISDESALELEMDDEDIKETLRDVLNELYLKETKNDGHKPS
jgi:hypothetical protein